jgi:hypothetical protein
LPANDRACFWHLGLYLAIMPGGARNVSMELEHFFLLPASFWHCTSAKIEMESFYV